MQKAGQKLLPSFACFLRKTNLTAFTLAEVLIVLGIIGLIADMTIPTLIASTQEKINIVKLKKVHSTLENAFRLAVSENGPPDEWGISTEGDSSEIIWKKFSPYLKTLRVCGYESGCFPNVTYKSVKNKDYVHWDTYSDRFKLHLADGTLLMINTSGTDLLAQFYVDTNGFSGPNKLGVDFFYFYMTKNGIIPGGSPAVFGNENFVNYCINKDGFACAAWVIYNENMDYLHCSDLSWDGKKSCN